jgi:hypothetical protein
MPLAKSKVSAPYLAEFVQIAVLGTDRWMRQAKDDDYVAWEIKARRRLIEGLFHATGLTQLFNQKPIQVLRLRLGLDQDHPGLKTRREVQQIMNRRCALLLREVGKIERAALNLIFQKLGEKVRRHRG